MVEVVERFEEIETFTLSSKDLAVTATHGLDKLLFFEFRLTLPLGKTSEGTGPGAECAFENAS